MIWPQQFKSAYGALMVALLCCTACSSDDEGAEVDTPTTSELVMVKYNGDNQIAWPYQPLPEQIRVRILDDIARPQKDLMVKFNVISGEGTLSSDTVYTNDIGVASVSWQLGGLGNQELEVTAFGPSGDAVRNSPMEFNARFPVSVCEPIEDVDGNMYPTAMIGNNCWMVQNLRTTRFRNGDSLPELTDQQAWASTPNPAYAWYDNERSLPDIYGKLYNWYAVADERSLCPTGWRIPNNDDFNDLAATLGGALEAGGEMKFIGNEYWRIPNTAATNGSGFSAVGGSYRHHDGTFVSWNDMATFWTTDEANTFNAWMRYLYHDQGNIVTMGNNKHSGLSVRCVAE